MPNEEPLEPRAQLRYVLANLRAPARPGEIRVVRAARVRVPGTGRVPENETVPVELRAEILRDTNGGGEILGWVFEGPLYVDDEDLRSAGGKLPAWIRAELGEHCIRVIVHGRTGNAVDARVEIRA